MSEVITGPCKRCSAPVTRTQGEGPFAAKINRLPLWCDQCVADDVEQRRVEDARHAEEDRLFKIERRIKESDLPSRHHAADLDALDHPPAVLDAARGWAERGGGLLLTGDVGRGKTTIAGAAALLRLASHRVLWTSAPLLFARLGSGLGSEQRDQALSLLSSRHSLVLDDIDKARPTEYGAEQVFLAIDQRVEYEAPLLVTSNLAPSQLAEKWPEPYGPAIASRLVGYCKVVAVEGVDRRLRSVS